MIPTYQYGLTPRKCSVNGYAYLYEILAGDSLSKIIKKIYYPKTPQDCKKILTKVLADNPEIKNPNLIRKGDLLYLEVPFTNNNEISSSLQSQLKIFKEAFRTLPEDAKVLMSVAAKDRTIEKLLLTITSSTGNFTSGALGQVNTYLKANKQILKELADNYTRYAKKEISKAVYNQRRLAIRSRLNLKNLTQRIIGRSTELTMREGKNFRSVLRMDKAAKFQFDKAMKLTKASKKLAKVGVATAILDLGISCYEMSQAPNMSSLKKNELLGNATGSTVGGTLGGAGTIALIAYLGLTPTGWATVVIVGIGSVAGGLYGSSKGGELFKVLHKKHNFKPVEKIGMDKVCK